MQTSQSQELPVVRVSYRRSHKFSQNTTNMRSAANSDLLHGYAPTKVNGSHRISFHPPSPSLHFSPHLSSNRPDSCPFEAGSSAQVFQVPRMEDSPIALAKPGATVNDGLFLALMMKNISTPTLVSTSNQGIDPCDTPRAGGPSYRINGNTKKIKPAHDRKVEYFDVGLERNARVSSGSAEDAKLESGDGEATVRSFLDFLEKCDAEFLRETARLSESIKYTKELIKQIRDERLSDCTNSGDSEAEASSSDEERTPVMRYTGHQGAFA